MPTTRCAPLVLVLLAGAAAAQTPLEDVGFSPTTGFPDPDLVVVRERAYASPGVDLGAYGIGGGTQTHIQSLYFRLFTGSPANEATANGLVILPPGVEVLGFITDGSDLGGSSDDGAATETDALFGIASDPDDYSANARGFNAGTADFVCKLAEGKFLFHLAISTGVDDFRAIIDYGDSFPADLSFELYTFGPGAFAGVAPSAGIRIGDLAGPGVLGSGDFGEVRSLVDIPLTSTATPNSTAALPYAIADSVFGIRDTGNSSTIDAFDLLRELPAPARFIADLPLTPVGLTSGPDGLFYVVGNGVGFSLFDPISENGASYTLDDLSGVNVSLTDYAGTRDLFFVRSTGSGTRVDRLGVDTLTFDQTFAFPSGVLTAPVGITDAGDGNLYILGSAGALVTLDPATGTLSSQTYSPPTGNYVGITRGAAPDVHLYLARNTNGNTRVDKFDTISGSMQHAFASFPSPGTPADITYGPGGVIIVQGRGPSAAAMIVLDPVTGAELYLHTCVDYTGTYAGVGWVQPSFGESYCGPAVPNSSGESAWVSVHGSDVAGGNPLDLAAWNLPPDKFGYFLTSRHQGFVVGPGGSQGNLCLGMQIGRYVGQVQNSGVLGRLRISIDTNAMPVSPPVAVLAGETWNFQAWYRDLVPFVSSNFTDAIAVTFR